MNTINFLYFCYNFNITQLEQLLEYVGMKQHFMDKWKSYGGGTQGFINLIMNMSRNNQLKAIKWIENNYKGI